MALFFGYHIPNFTFRGVANSAHFSRVVEQARAAEAAGFDAITLMDHSYQIPVRRGGPLGQGSSVANGTVSAGDRMGIAEVTPLL